MRVHEIVLMPPGASHNTLYIQLIHYGRRICKKVYWDARAREGEGRREGDPCTSRAPKIPLSLSFKGPIRIGSVFQF